MKKCSCNEQCLLKFISANDYDAARSDDILDAVFKLGIKLKFKDSNPVYQIIDELTYGSTIGK